MNEFQELSKCAQHLTLFSTRRNKIPFYDLTCVIQQVQATLTYVLQDTLTYVYYNILSHGISWDANLGEFVLDKSLGV